MSGIKRITESRHLWSKLLNQVLAQQTGESSLQLTVVIIQRLSISNFPDVGILQLVLQRIINIRKPLKERF